MAFSNVTSSGVDVVTGLASMSFEDHINVTDTANRTFSSGNHSPLQYITVIFYLITFLFGVLGNSLVIYILARFSEVRQKSVANYYIFNLALADEIFTLTLPVFCYVTFTEKWIFGAVTCKILYVLRESNKFGSIFTLVALSVDRYIASFHNLGQYRTIRVGICVCICVWLLSMAMCTPYILYADVDPKQKCKVSWPSDSFITRKRVWSYSQLIIGLVVPFLLILVSYILLLRRLKAIMKPRKSDRIRKPNRKMNRTIAVVVITFLVCNVPYYIMDILNLKKTEALMTLPRDQLPSQAERKLYGYFYALSTILVFISSCCNPVLYGILNDNYRNLYKITLCCYRGKRHSMTPRTSVTALKNSPNGGGELVDAKASLVERCDMEVRFNANKYNVDLKENDSFV